MIKRMFPLAVHLFLIKGNQVLLLRRYNTGYEDGKYSVVAGHVDGGEDVYTAMIREAKEEAGIDISIENLKIIQVMHRKKLDEERIDYFFECSEWSGDIAIIEPDKCDRLDWIDINNLPDNTIDYIHEALKNRGEGIAFSVYGW